MASTQVNIPIGLWPSGCWRAGTPMEIPKLDRLTDIELNIIGYVIINLVRVRAGGAKLAELNIEIESNEISRPTGAYSLTVDRLMTTAAARSATDAQASNTPCGLWPMVELNPIREER